MRVAGGGASVLYKRNTGARESHGVCQAVHHTCEMFAV